MCVAHRKKRGTPRYLYLDVPYVLGGSTGHPNSIGGSEVKAATGIEPVPDTGVYYIKYQVISITATKSDEWRQSKHHIEHSESY